MSSFAPPVQRLVTELSKLPGVGSRTAQRLAFHILRASSEDAFGLAEAIKEVKEKVGLCEVCFNLADEPRCRICQDTRRDASVICVVEEPSDVIPMERTHEFNGLYHVATPPWIWALLHAAVCTLERRARVRSRVGRRTRRP